MRFSYISAASIKKARVRSAFVSISSSLIPVWL
nr:MAG TPA: hypothetical protein [Caudoviricetes sp.]DAR38786.1 MAG TPA: hypothetical protein [Caudoviricetes sp.]